MLSFITPPVCVAVYIASPIAGSEPMRTALQAVKLAIVAYIVPFIFVISPALLLMGNVQEIMLIVPTSVLGFAALAITVQGYLFSKMGIPSRVLLGIGAALLLLHQWIINIIGFAVVVATILWEWNKARTKRKTVR